MEATPLDLSVRLAILETFARGEIPVRTCVATALRLDADTVASSYRRFAARPRHRSDPATDEVWLARLT